MSDDGEGRVLGVGGWRYPYFGYPALLWLIAALGGRRPGPVAETLPTLTLIIPVHNEAARIAAKVANTRALDYPPDRLQVLFVSDGSADDTTSIIRSMATPGMEIVEVPVRRGKANALNAGLAHARHEILVFSDASIQLEPGALQRLVAPFADPRIGCVSGEDRISDGGGEGLYGRYELALRRLESRVHSIAGASGSFYAQRRSLCAPFLEGLAPDFLSVLRTVGQGARAVSEVSAVGAMSSVRDPRQEFERKVRTLLRGMTTLFAYSGLLNPWRSGWFAFVLFSHKLMRWSAPFFLAGALAGAAALAPRHPFYLAAFAAQALFYLIAFAAFIGVAGVGASRPGRIALFFSSSNVAILVAWLQYARGVRQELWTPSRR